MSWFRSRASFLVRHPVSKNFLAWSMDMSNPEESFFATLIRVSIAENGTGTLFT